MLTTCQDHTAAVGDTAGTAAVGDRIVCSGAADVAGRTAAAPAAAARAGGMTAASTAAAPARVLPAAGTDAGIPVGLDAAPAGLAAGNPAAAAPAVANLAHWVEEKAQHSLQQEAQLTHLLHFQVELLCPAAAAAAGAVGEPLCYCWYYQQRTPQLHLLYPLYLRWAGRARKGWA